RAPRAGSWCSGRTGSWASRRRTTWSRCTPSWGRPRRVRSWRAGGSASTTAPGASGSARSGAVARAGRPAQQSRSTSSMRPSPRSWECRSSAADLPRPGGHLERGVNLVAGEEALPPAEEVESSGDLADLLVESFLHLVDDRIPALLARLLGLETIEHGGLLAPEQV